ncbi:hypothetical protein Mapa_003988 [Marchantia paleacea]|nr:hypothetical protein Mapa_003988 [Marchantia paleacea]
MFATKYTGRDGGWQTKKAADSQPSSSNICKSRRFSSALSDKFGALCSVVT